MPTLLRSFPEVSRQGHQTTGWSAAIPATIRFLQLQGQASNAVLSDPANAITFTISVSPDGTDATAQIVNIEPWTGGMFLNHQNALVAKVIDVTFGPLDRFIGWRVKLEADINLASGVPIVVGGTVTSLP